MPQSIDPPLLRRSIGHFQTLVELWEQHGDTLLVELQNLSRNIEEQLKTPPPEKTEHWLGRARHVKRLTDDSIAYVKKWVSDRNRAQSATVAAVESKWSAFAERLAEVLADTDPVTLEQIEGPGENLTAAEWLTARRAQRDKKRAGR